MPYRTMMQGINAIKQGHLDEGARLLRIALRDDGLSGSLRATAYVWLAETRTERSEKIRCYQDALAEDPNNADANQRLATLTAKALDTETPAQPVDYNNRETSTPAMAMPPTPPPAPPPSAQSTQPPSTPPPTADASMATAKPPSGVPPGSTGAPVTPPPGAEPATSGTVGIVDGPNGVATGFFVTQEGLIATTRFAVGGAEQVTIELDPGNTITGQVVRTFPEIDLALIHTGLTVNQRLPVSHNSDIPAETALTALSHYSDPVHAKLRTLHSIIKPEWIPTTFTTAHIPDIGGNPLLDNQGHVVGMLTSNGQRSAQFIFGLNIVILYRYVDLYHREMSTGSELVYCSTCGHLSRAGTAGAYYCEYCGAVLPMARRSQRLHVPQMTRFYDDPRARPCPHCGARSGFYEDSCLACGQDVTVQR